MWTIRIHGVCSYGDIAEAIDKIQADPDCVDGAIGFVSEYVLM